MAATMEVLIQRVTDEADHIRSYELVNPDGGDLPAFSAGAHIDLYLADGLIRQYSLFNSPAERQRYCIAVLKAADSKGGSRRVHETLKAGDRLRISAPRNLFELDPEARDSLLIAGGIGITPILAMASQLRASNRSFQLHYCFRQSATAAFVAALQSGPLAANSHLHCSSEGTRLDTQALLAQPVAGRHLYVCGSAQFIDQILTTAKQQGWPDNQLHREYFEAAETAQEGDCAFEIRVGDRSFTVAANQTAAEVLEANGISVAVSCGQGICGSCLTRVVEGVPDHRDLYLTEEEQAANDIFTPCCSRSHSPYLVLAAD